MDAASRSDQVPLLPQQMLPPPPPSRARARAWFVSVCACIVVWTYVVQLLTVGHLWRSSQILLHSAFAELFSAAHSSPLPPSLPASKRPLSAFFLPLVIRRRVRGSTCCRRRERIFEAKMWRKIRPKGVYRSNGYLKVSCNGGLNQMRSAICDMVTVARILNLTMVVPELDKKSFWADPSNFDDIFDVDHFIDSLKHEVHIVKRLPRKLSTSTSNSTLVMPPVSWSSEAYYLNQILPLFSKYEVVHFNKTDARLANNGLSVDSQRLRCYVNYHALKFNKQIEVLGNKLVNILKKKGHYVALHLRYEMDMLALGMYPWMHCGRSKYAYPWWREKEIDSEKRRLQGLCPLTPEETSLVLQAFGFEKNIPIYVAAGEIYGSERRLAPLLVAFPQMVKKEMLLDPKDLWQFQNHSSQMAALDYIVSIASDVFIPTYDGNMAKVVEGHRRYLGVGKSIKLDRRRLVELLDSYQNKMISWDQFSNHIRLIHEKRMGQPMQRTIIANKPKEEDSFYANPQECLCNMSGCIWNVNR